MRRYQHRYFNGRSWTADVAQDGQRFVDQLGIVPTPVGPSGPVGGSGPAASAPASNALATAAMVLGIIAVSISWLPYAVVLGLLAALLALVFGIIGLRRARTRGVGRAFAVTGLVTGFAALALSAVGITLTGTVNDALDDYSRPGPHEVEVTSCEVSGSRATMTGELTNTGRSTNEYSVLVGFARGGTDNVVRREWVEVGEVAADATAEFEAESTVAVDEVECIIVQVNGPLPFGLEIE
jgi:hypothetical protein